RESNERRNSRISHDALISREKLLRKSCLDCARPVVHQVENSVDSVDSVESKKNVTNVQLFNFVHPDRENKVASIAQMRGSGQYSVKEVLAEMDKCIMLCANCSAV